MKISFDIKYRPQIESGEYKVETKNGYQVEILKFGIEGPDFHIAGIIHRINFDQVMSWTNNGMYHPEIFRKESPDDLVLITPEPELTESEDDRIRKDIIEHFQYEIEELSNKGEEYEAEIEELSKYITYLEKQKEQKPAEWSEEDEKRRTNILRLITEADDRYIKEASRSPFCAEILWLKSLHSRPMTSDNWKPSVEQLKVLKEAIFYFGDSWVSRKYQVLQSLYEDLMKV